MFVTHLISLQQYLAFCNFLSGKYNYTNTLNIIISAVSNLYQDGWRSSSNNIWDDLFDYGSLINNNGSLANPFFQNILKEILFKGTGDLFQEINSVCKNGGYVGNLYQDDEIDKYEDGNSFRYFAANDRPSGTRFMFMLSNGNPSQINQKAFGGYFSNAKNVLLPGKAL